MSDAARVDAEVQLRRLLTQRIALTHAAGSDQRLFAGARGGADEAADALRDSSRPPGTWLIGRDLAEARAGIATLAPAACSSVVSLAVRLSRAGLEAARPQERAAVARGIDNRTVVDIWGLMPDAGPAMEADERSRIRLACVNQRMIIIDERAVVIDGPPLAGDERTTWLVQDEVVARTATAVFVAAWRRGRRIDDEASAGPVPLTSRQWRIAAMLLTGRSEPAIAALLEISRRTVTNEVAAMCRALGATGRVDLGYRLRALEEHAAGPLDQSAST